MELNVHTLKEKLAALSTDPRKKIIKKSFEFSIELIKDSPKEVFEEIYEYLKKHSHVIEDFDVEGYIDPETFKVVLLLKVYPIASIRSQLIMTHWEEISKVNVAFIEISEKIEKTVEEQLRKEDTLEIRKYLAQMIEKILKTKIKGDFSVEDMSILEINEPKKEILCENPLIYTVENFLTYGECEHFIEISRERMERSKVVSKEDGVDGEFCDDRTGSNTFVSHDHTPLTLKIAKRIADTVGISAENAEDFQVVHYEVGQFYNYHYDTFDPETESRYMEDGGQRVLTALVYLNDVVEGGETGFRELKINSQAKGGKLLVFETVVPGTTDQHPNTIHAGLPVIKGEKYAFNLWFREKKRDKYSEKKCNFIVKKGGDLFTLNQFLDRSEEI
jgi:prolyl 4-hydroxylase